MNKQFLEIIRIIFTIITILLATVTAIFILLKLTGHSPTETTIIFSIIGVLITLQVVIISVLFQIKEDLGSLKEFKRETIHKIKNIENTHSSLKL